MAVVRATFDFFEAQRSARRRSALLLLYYLLALPGVALVIHLFVWLGVAFSDDGPTTVGLWDPGFFGATLVLTVLVVGPGTLYHLWSLARGGPEGLARSLGGEPVPLQALSDGDQRLRNVVEEMAIASGLPVPTLYVLRGEAGINAFAAGFAPDRAVVAVTEGCLTRLTRDELQGVIAHELSHVQNGDMRLNLRLLALAGGLSSLALVGRVLMNLGSSRDRRNDKGNGGIGIIGLGLLLAGLAGTFFARLIRAAVARQREYLADAASAQFTRNPAALAGALGKIAGYGSALASPMTPEASHLLFADGRTRSWLADHPPVEARIRRLLALGETTPLPRFVQVAPSAAPATATATGSFGRPPPLVASLAGASSQPSAPNPETTPGLAAAARLLDGLPAALTAAAREPFGARALCAAVLLDGRPEVRARQQAVLAEGPEGAEVLRLAPLLDGVDRAHRLTLLDLALPALGALSPPQRARLQADLRRLAEADGRLTVTEWVYLRVVDRRLSRLGGAGRPQRPRAFTVEQVAVECHELLGLLARVGAREEVAAQAALDAGVTALGLPATWRLPPVASLQLGRLDAVLATLEATPFELRARVLRACEACASADGALTDGEVELLHAVADAMGMARPPPLPRAS
jgi:Zn-dependent protease with chaperone function